MPDCDCEERTGEICFRCKLHSIQFSPAAMPSRRNHIPPRVGNNSWEKGIAKDERGMPLLGDKGTPIGLHELAGKRGDIEARVRELKNTPPSDSKD